MAAFSLSYVPWARHTSKLEVVQSSRAQISSLRQSTASVSGEPWASSLIPLPLSPTFTNWGDHSTHPVGVLLSIVWVTICEELRIEFVDDMSAKSWLSFIIQVHKELLCDQWEKKNLPQEASGDLLQWHNKNWDCPVRAPMLMMLGERLMTGEVLKRPTLLIGPEYLVWHWIIGNCQYLAIVGLQTGNFIWFDLITEPIWGLGHSWFKLHSFLTSSHSGSW